ncbi:Aste57867_12463 [Aphanomyces stellatus]|uniref:Aste57867_12463 protein n=1 Tax=Aphanomyces stellatus TaxID=120398 RepID=A0A485KVL1_9STRA|nr:hypothetical protein As57867_012417 [Aphanomyces stellatus]VFT89314.1 Aste57867_12463 [Aphanomyces stellatus]
MSTKINNGLFMGDIDAAQDAEFLSLNGIEFIVNCVPREVPNVFEQDGIRYMAIDMAEQPESILFDLRNEEFADLIEFIDHAMQSSLSLLVHSLDGMSRSPCVMMAYLMSKYQWSLDKAYEYVKMKRPDINPANGYLDQLSTLDTQLQKKHRVSEKKRNEWDSAFADPKTDEIVLVNTFLNVTNGVALPHDAPSSSSSRKAKKKRLLWIDLCPHMRKLNPTYDFSKLERPPSASYSSLSAGNGWVDTMETSVAAPPPPRPATPAATAVHASRAAAHHHHHHAPHPPIVDLSLSDDEAERLSDAAKEDDSWDMSMSDPGMSHDADFDKPHAASWLAEPSLPTTRAPPSSSVQTANHPPPLVHRSSFPSQHIKKSAPTSTMGPPAAATAGSAFPPPHHASPGLLQKVKTPLADFVSQNQQHSPTDDSDNQHPVSSLASQHPRYLQHTKSSRNAKTIKAAQGRYAMPVVDDKLRQTPPPSSTARRQLSAKGEGLPLQETTTTTRLPTTARKQPAPARPKTAPPPSAASRSNASMTSTRMTNNQQTTASASAKKKAPVAPKQPRPPPTKQGSLNAMLGDSKKSAPPPSTMSSTPDPFKAPRRASSAKWR